MTFVSSEPWKKMSKNSMKNSKKKALKPSHIWKETQTNRFKKSLQVQIDRSKWIHAKTIFKHMKTEDKEKSWKQESDGT